MSAIHPSSRGLNADRGGSKWLAVAGLAGIGLLAGTLYLAVSRPVDPEVIVHEVSEVPPITATSHVAAPPNLQGSTTTGASSGPTAANSQATTTPTCQGPQPGPSWSCHPEGWQVGPPPAPVASGGGRIDRAGGCLTEQPGNGFTCQNGLWVLAGTSSNNLGAAPQAQPSGEPECRAPRPGNDWVCENGAWVPPLTTPIAPVPPVSPPTAGTPPDASEPPQPAPPAPTPTTPEPSPTLSPQSPATPSDTR